MIECLIVGDSIAVGVHQHRPECAVYAKVGINSRDWNNKYLGKDLAANTVIISLGSNDHRGIKTAAELLDLRQTIKAARVVWILPNNHDKIELIKQLAAKYNDGVAYIPEVSKDKVHPTANGYKQLANMTR